MKKLSLLLICTILLCACGKSDPKEDPFEIDKEMTISFNFGDRTGTYTGEINANGLPDGIGKFKCNKSGDNERWTYYGEWDNGHFEGNGITEWDTYSHFGFYKSDYMDGAGMYYFKDGSIKSGEFEESQLVKESVSRNFSQTSDYTYAKSWAEAAFGENAMYSEITNDKEKSTNFFQVIVPSEYTCDDVDKIMQKIKTSYVTLNLLNITYDTVSVKYISTTNKEILDIQFNLKHDGKYELSVISGDLENSKTIVSKIDS